MIPCACGCGKSFDTSESKSRGEPRLYYAPACRQRHHRQKQKALRNAKIASVVPVIKPILKYPGAKWSRASEIVKHFPQHTRYLEPFAGSAACFFRKDPVEHEVLGDTNRSLTNLFQVIRERAEEL